MPAPSPSRPNARTMQYDRVPVPQVQRSSFDRNSSHKTTFDSGYLIPVYVDEILPGDTVSMSASFFGRLQTLEFPILDNIYFDTFWFYCPWRLLWTNFPRFLGAQDNPSSSIDYALPVMEDGPEDTCTIVAGSIGDYFGLLVEELAAGDNPIAGPWRMYYRVWNEWFRDQNMQNSLTMEMGDGPEAITNYVLQKRGKRHDYISSVLPSPQKGDAIPIPLGTEAPVIGDGSAIGFLGSTGVGTGHGYLGFRPDAGTGDAAAYFTDTNSAAGTTPPAGSTFTGNRSLGLATNAAASHVIADLSAAIGLDLNQLRESIALQHILERDARMGTRYTERIFGTFGVVVPDFTAQRPEYLGGSIDRVTLLQVPQMTASPAVPTMADAKGALAAYAQLQAQSGFNRTFVEHGFIMCLANVRADLNWQHRLDRMWTRETRYDIFDPALAHLGEQAVLNREVWYDTADPQGVFGYQERWGEMRSKMNIISGKFRSEAAGTLDVYHLALDFDAQPDLNAAFIVDSPPLERVLSITTEPQVLMDAYFRCRHVRPMPIRSVPGLDRL